jgi:hypothetical protein
MKSNKIISKEIAVKNLNYVFTSISILRLLMFSVCIGDAAVRSIVELNYRGWKIRDKTFDLTSRATIWAGQHYFEHSVILQNGGDAQLVIGLPTKSNVEIARFSSPSGSKSNYSVATLGKQVLQTGATATTESMPDQNLELAIISPNDSLPYEGLNDKANHLLKIPLEKSGVSCEGSFMLRHFGIRKWKT